MTSSDPARRGLPAEHAAYAERAEHAACGRVVLVGAGPGDPELLTLKAQRHLRQARLVLYDHLVSAAVLAQVSPRARLIYVGKQAARHAMPQAEIIGLMLRLARNGHSLVRLKGGDGFVFGRGGEEAQALAEAGIGFEVVPGITAAQAAGACAGIPLTHRDHAATLVFATGHLRRDAGLGQAGGAGGNGGNGETGESGETGLDWPLLARPRQTVVIYMGLATLPVICRELQRHGLPGRTPAALVEQASLPGQRCLTGTLETLADLARREGVQSPALVVIGEVVALQPVLARAMAQAPGRNGDGECDNVVIQLPQRHDRQPHPSPS